MLPGSTSSRRGTPQKSEQSTRIPVTRSKSFLGVIKDLVAPLTWFAETEDNSEDVNGKRRRLVQSDARVDAAESGTPNKRQRVGSSDRQVGSGYLDPPLPQLGDSRLSQSQSSSPSHFPRSSSVLTHSTTIQRPPHDRHSISPLATTSESRPLGMTRTMSTDLFTRHGPVRDVTMMSVSREPSMHASFTRDSTSVRRDTSVPVSRTPFRMRTSLTPQLSTSHFGPTVKYKERDPSEPPPLASLMSQPIFVKAPRETPEPRAMSVQPAATLGSVVDSQRSSHVRQYSSLLGSQPDPPPHLPNGYHAINPAEKALHELDVYKTPLLPTRLQTSAAIPDMFKPKKPHTLIPMHEKDDRYRGSGKKRGKGKEQINGTKPYAGAGGLKRLLARRKLEEEEENAEKEQEDAAAMADDSEKAGEEPKRNDLGSQAKTTPVKLVGESEKPKLTPLVVPRPEPHPSPISQSSLRVGRTKTSRNHIARPTARSVNRFSAFFDEEEGENNMQEDNGKKGVAVLEEAAPKVPVFEPPTDFSFASETAPIKHDLVNAKEPPMAALPFSFTKPSKPVDVPTPEVPPVKEPDQRVSAPLFGELGDRVTRSTTSAGGPTSVFATPAQPPSASAALPGTQPRQEPSTTPAPESKPAFAPPAGDAVPNFFPKPSAFAKPVAPGSSALGSGTLAHPVRDVENPFWQGGKVTEPVKPSSQAAFQFAAPPSSEPKASAPERPPFALFGSGDTPSKSVAFGTGFSSTPTSSVSETPVASAVGKENEQATPPSLFGGRPNQVPLTPPTPAFSFGAPPKPAETAITAPPLFPFGTAKNEPAKESVASSNPAPAAATPPTLFGNSSPVVSRFQAPVAATPEPSKSAFVFNSLTPEPQTPATPAPTFSFGTTPAAPPPASPFSFGAAPATPPAVAADKKPLFTFPTSAASTTPAPVFPSSAPAGSSSASDVSSKPFIFGTATTRPATPPKNEDQEIRMEESPTRDMQLNGIEKGMSRPAPFSFNSTSTTSSFGQATQPSSGPFSFNAPSTGFFNQKPESTTEQKLPLTFSGFGQTQTSTAFGPKSEQPSSTTPAPFSFSTTPTAPAGPSFAFRAPATNNPFGQSTAGGGSSPSSPSTFAQPSSPFSFSAPISAAPQPFTFGSSQPASPASAGNANLPAPAAPGVFAFNSSPTTQPAPPFSAPTPAPPPGGTLFTIGAAPSGPPPGARQVKRLPMRRGKR